jgi:hypothetical protein
LRANASLQRSVSYRRLSEQEQELVKTVERLLSEAERTDAEEDQRYGKGRSREDLPEHLAHAQSRLQKIQEAKRQLEQEAAEELERARREHPGAGRRGRPRKGEQAGEALSKPEREKRKNRLKRARRKAAQPSRAFNFTDPDSRIMRDNGRKCYVQGYNAQLAVDGHAQVIVAADVTQEVVDRGQLLPMCARVRETVGKLPSVLTADAGYWDTLSIEDSSLENTQVLVAPGATHAGAKPRHCRPESAMERMRELLKAGPTRELYRLRQAIVEPVFGHIKQARGLRRFSLRGLTKVKAEWNLICLTHNVLKLYRHVWLTGGA